MIELDVIEPEAVPVAPRRRGRRRAVVAGVALLALVGGGLAVAGGRGPKAAPLALMAGSGPVTEGRTMAAPAAATAGGGGVAVGAPAADGKALIGSGAGWWGLEFRVAGDLPDLGDHAAAWNVSGSPLDKTAVARIASALGVTGAPVARDGGWFVDNGDWTLAATPGGDTWSVSYYRSKFAAADDAAGATLSRAEAEQRVRDLIDRMGAPSSRWEAQVMETQVGPGWACAAPAVAVPAPELTKEEADKLRLEESPNTGAAGSSTGSAPGAVAPTRPAPAPAPDKPVDGIPTPACPPPPPPAQGFNVALFPVLDGHRADWALWNVTLRSDGTIENLYGSWATFDRAGDYKLRTVDAALKDLSSAPRPMPALAGGTTLAADAPPGVGEPSPATAPPPVCPPAVMPLTPDKATASYMPACTPAAPPVVPITGVELGLMPAPVWDGGRARSMLVPAYRFLGHFDGGAAWETSVIALHPDAIAPPPDVPVAVDGRESVGPATVGKAVPPTPPDSAIR